MALGLLGLSGLFGLSTLAAPRMAQAQMVEQEPAVPRVEAVQGTVGVRTTVIRSAGFDPFAGSDVLAQISAGVERPFVRQGNFVVAAGLGLDYGEANSAARGVPSRLSLLRLTVVAEGRYYLAPYAYAFGRFAPGVLSGSAGLTDASSPNGARLDDRFDLLAADTSAGGAFRLSGPVSPVGAWIIVEGGYGWAQSHRLLLAPEADARDQPKIAAVDLGTLSPRGMFMRFALAITY
jgi:hypothetical protein